MSYEQRLLAAAKLVIASDTQRENFHVNAAQLGIAATLKPHQIEGFSWLIGRYIAGINVILGDEMGLGKTLQALSLLCYLKIQKISNGPFLVICPLSVVDGWSCEISNFASSLKVLKYIGGKEHRCSLRRQLYEHVKIQSTLDLPFHVLLTTYDVALVDQDFLSQFPWHFSIFDEAQRLKNPSSVLYNVLVKRFIMPRRLVITGTPIQNNLTELWSLLHFCMPSVFNELEQFLSTFKEAANSSGGDNTTKLKKRFTTLKYILRAFMLRRTKFKLIEAGALTLPPLTEVTLMVPLVALQKKVYVSILRKELAHLLAFSTGAYNHQSLQNIVIQLRKVCSHPYMFPGIEPEPYVEGEHLVQASGKLTVLDKLLHNLCGTGHRVLLFAQMTLTLDILQDLMELREYSYERLDGSVRAEERFAAIRSFNTPSAESRNSFVFLISTRAGGVGLNLVAADTVIFFEQDWNPQADRQALQRAHRIGQSNPVLVINLVSERTVEEVIMRRAERKLQLSRSIIEEDVRGPDEPSGIGARNLSAVVCGLRVFDEAADDLDSSKLDAAVANVIAVRGQESADRPFEINKEGAPTVRSEPHVDEAAYADWVKQFAGSSPAEEATTRRSPPPLPPPERETGKVEEERKMMRWKAKGYTSLSVKIPEESGGDDVPPVLAGLGSVYFVYGDCTCPSTLRPGEPAVIFSCVDNSGVWGRGGMFDALDRVSDGVGEAYGKASAFSDLRTGDVHVVAVGEQQWVALAVAQSYDRRRNVPRSALSLPHLDVCLHKTASFSASHSSASIHMPRIGYRESADRSDWYAIERLLRKYSSLYGVNIFVYYYCRA